LLGIAETGTGKTAAFVLPILHRILETPHQLKPRSAAVLILAPTRELAVQIGERTKAYGRNLRLKQAIVVGGVGQEPQVRALSQGVDILIATPGRLIDLMEQRHLRLDWVSTFVIDEADRMFDMGFIRPLRRIVAALPKARQTILFSATMPPEVERLAGEILRNAVRINISPPTIAVERIDQRVFFVDAGAKRSLLNEMLLDPSFSRVLVFMRTKHSANKVAQMLAKTGVSSDAIHGNKSQGARQAALSRFKTGQARVLVATDVAARGLDIEGVTHVINFDIPHEPESYVHRIGRTARAGAEGIALSFCDAGERGSLRDIERLIKRQLSVAGHRKAEPGEARAAAADDRASRPAHGKSRHGRPGNGHGKSAQAHGKPHRKGGHQQGTAKALHADGEIHPHPAAKHGGRNRKRYRGPRVPAAAA
jgi:ATP-dependent RNA helicase RhlE